MRGILYSMIDTYVNIIATPLTSWQGSTNIPLSINRPEYATMAFGFKTSGRCCSRTLTIFSDWAPGLQPVTHFNKAHFCIQARLFTDFIQFTFTRGPAPLADGPTQHPIFIYKNNARWRIVFLYLFLENIQEKGTHYHKTFQQKVPNRIDK